MKPKALSALVLGAAYVAVSKLVMRRRAPTP